ncbi:MAG: diguanylate cyclase, partial [Betaproteobacteria bacterium]
MATGPLVLVLGYAVYEDYQTAYRDANESVARVAEVTAAAAQELSSNVRATLDYLARDPLVKAMDPARCSSAIKDLHAVNPPFLSIITTDRDGYFICSASPLPSDRKLRVVDLDMVRRTVEGGTPGISQPYQGRITGKWGLSFVDPVTDATGRVTGTVAIGVDLLGWNFLAKTPALLDGSVITIVSGNGTIIARSESAAEWVGRSALDNPAGQAALQMRDGMAIAKDQRAEERHYAFKSVSGTDWVVMVGLSRTVVQADSWKLLLRSGLLALVCVLSAVFAALVLTRRMIAPIRAMVRAIRAHAAGDADLPVPVAGPSELVELADGMNRSIASRAAAEGALRRAQHMAKLAHVITGPGGSFESWSDTLPTLIGIDPARMPQSTREWLENIQPEDRAAFRAKAIEAGRTGWRTEVEYRLRRPDGEVIFIKQLIEPLQRNAEPPGEGRWFNTLLDVTDQKQAEERLRHSETLKGAILASSLDAIVTIDEEGRFVEFNPAAEAMFGISRDQALGRVMVETIVPPHLRDAHRRGFAECLATGKGTIFGKRLEMCAVRADTTEFPVELVIAAVGSKAAPLFSGFIGDITERKEAERRIKRLNRVYAVLSGINTLIVRVRDRDELFRGACRIAVEDGGFPMTLIALVDRAAMTIVPVASAGMDDDLLTGLRNQFASNEGMALGNTLAARVIRDKRTIVATDLQDNPMILFGDKYAELGIHSIAILPFIVANEAVGLLALYAREIEFFHEEELKLLTELTGDVAFAIDHIDKQERLDYLAYYDALTGLANRSLVLERLAQYMRSASSGGHQLAVIMLDLDRFKSINDSLGQPAGDELLRQTARWLTRIVGDVNLVARVGADQFVVVVPEVKRTGNLARLVEKAMHAFLDHPFRLNDGVFRIAGKLGIALFPEDGISADTLFKNAEAALKRAKARGELYLFYTQQMTDRAAATLTLENKLRQALDREEFVLHYQPKVNFSTGKVAGAEALIRWNDSSTGLMP